jgi:hypothetical protein
VRIAKSVLRDNESTGVGGAIDMSDEGELRIVASVLRGNVSQNTAGAIRDGEAPITIIRSKLIRNQSENDGGAIRFSSSAATILDTTFKRNRSLSGDGGAIESDLEGPLTITRSTFANNRTGGNGGGIYGVGAEQLRIDSSTLSGNRAGENGGGVYIDGPPALIVNSTLDGNRANTRGGGIHAQDGADLRLNAVTVTRNVAAADDEGPVLIGGGGLSRISSAGFDVRNSLIALNTIGAAQSTRNDCAGDTPFDSLGNNLLSSPVVGANCQGFEGPNDIVRAQPKIGQLKDNGGPTKTVALKAGSAAIGHAHKPSAPDRDQRGRGRDNDPDTGAFERGA